MISGPMLWISIVVSFTLRGELVFRMMLGLKKFATSLKASIDTHGNTSINSYTLYLS